MAIYGPVIVQCRACQTCQTYRQNRIEQNMVKMVKYDQKLLKHG